MGGEAGKRESWVPNNTKKKDRKRQSSLGDKSCSVDRWRGCPWIQPLSAWWLIAIKMSTSPGCSHCSHSARCVFRKYSRPDKQERTRSVRASEVHSLCKCSVFIDPKNKNGCFTTVFESCYDWWMKGRFFSAPSCFTLMGLFDWITENKREYVEATASYIHSCF